MSRTYDALFFSFSITSIVLNVSSWSPAASSWPPLPTPLSQLRDCGVSCSRAAPSRCGGVAQIAPRMSCDAILEPASHSKNGFIVQSHTRGLFSSDRLCSWVALTSALSAIREISFPSRRSSFKAGNGATTSAVRTRRKLCVRSSMISRGRCLSEAPEMVTMPLCPRSSTCSEANPENA
uniref:Secreted protein n=1 Tax=Anopheles atroparvus TaxID=41427 RepID=A0AAG5DIY6_ANOAO